MAKYQITAPDGSVQEVTAPDTASQADVIAYAQKNFVPKAATPAATPAASTPPAEQSWTDKLSNLVPDWMKLAGSAAYKGVAGFPAAAADVLANQPSATDAFASLGGGQAKADFDNLYNKKSAYVSPVQDALQSTGYQPKTDKEKVADSLLQAASSSVWAPGNSVKNAVTALSSSSGQQLMKKYAPGTGAAGQVAGAVAGAIAGHGANIVASIPWKNANTVASKALEGVTPAELQAAQAKMTDAAAGDTPINLNVAQALGKPSNLDTVVAALANNSSGKQTAELLRNQPAQVATAASGAVGDLPGMITNAADAANPVQKAAGQFMTNTRNFRTEAASPYWEAQKQADLGAVGTGAQLQDVKDQIAKAVATQQSAAQVGGKLTALANQQAETNYYLGRHAGGTGEVGAPPAVVPGAAEGAQEAQQTAVAAAQRAKALQSVSQQLADSPQLASQQAVRGQVSDLVGQIDQKMQIAGPEEAKILQGLKDQLAPNGQPLQFPSQLESVRKSISAPLTATSTQAERTAAGVIGPYADQIGALVDGNSPSIQQGRKVYQQMTQDYVTPAKQSVTGVIAGPKGVPLDTQTTASRLASVFNKGTNPQGTSQIMKLADDLRTVDGGAEAFNNAAVTHLSDKIQAAIDGTENNAGNIKDALYGNAMKAQGTREILVNMAKNQGLRADALYPGFEKVMSYIDSAAKRPNVVAGQSAPEIAKAAGNSHGAGILTMFSSGQRAVSNYFSNGAYKQIDSMLNTPQGVDQLMKLSKQLNSATGPKTEAAISAFLASTSNGGISDSDSKK